MTLEKKNTENPHGLHRSTISMFYLTSFAVLAAAIYAASMFRYDADWFSSAKVWLLEHNATSVSPPPPTTNTTPNDWNLLYHLGGNGPWIPKISDVVEGGVDPPEGCRVDQVHMMSRHAERYPTLRASTDMVNLLNRLRNMDVDLQNNFSFFKNWSFFMDYPDTTQKIGNLTSTGPYAGTLGASSTGVKLRTQYKDLVDLAIKRNKTHFWAADSNRVVETAKLFATGFFGVDWRDTATLHIVPETAELGADTLTTGVTCKNYVENLDGRGRDYGFRKLREYQKTYISPIVRRLEEQNPGVGFTIQEIYTMQELCGFEVLARGSSPWCGIFTHEEWAQFEYARDLLHYYRSGLGNKYGAARGWPFLNATMNLLSQGSKKTGPLFLSFVHDGDIIPLLAALDLLPEPQDLPTTHTPLSRTWRTSQITPMGGRVILERLACPVTYCHTNAPLYPNHVYCDAPTDEVFVRVNINDGVVAIPDCDAGPGRSCPVQQFERKVMLRGWEVGDFRKTCGLSDDSPGRITFLHQ